MAHRSNALHVLATMIALSSGCGERSDAGLAPAGSATSVAPAVASSAAVAPAGELPPLPVDDDPPPPPPPPPPSSLPMTDAQVAAFLAKPKAPITAAIYETILLRLASCARGTFSFVDPACPAAKDHSKLKGRLIFEGEAAGPVALRHLRHPSPVVRYEATSPASSYAFRAQNRSDADERLFLDAMRAETDPKVLANQLFFCSEGAARNPAILRFVLRSLEHADDGVRAAALRTIAKPVVRRQVPGAFERLALGTKADRGRLERMASCEHVGLIGDPRAVPLLAALLDDATLPDDIRGACFEGLVGTWSSHDGQVDPSKEGYELTLKTLQAKPRSSTTPPHRGVMALASATRDRTLPDGAKWSERVRGFYDVGALSDALASIVLDDQANRIARRSAAFALLQLAQKPTIEATLRSLKTAGGDGPSLAEEMERDIQRDRELFAEPR